MEFDLDGKTYRINKMPVRTQFHVVRRLGPVLGSVGPLLKGLDLSKIDDPETRTKLFNKVLDDVLPGIAQTIAEMSDADSDYVVNCCMMAVDRQEPTGWVKVSPRIGVIMFADLDLMTIMQLVYKVLQDNLGSFFGASRSGSLLSAAAVTSG